MTNEKGDGPVRPSASRLDLVVRTRRAVTSAGEVACSVAIAGGQIVAVEAYDCSLESDRQLVLDGDVVLLPGLVDSHVHICEPGNTDWEGFETATRAAAAGGITALVDMPLDSMPVTVDVPSLQEKASAAAGKCHVDVGFWGGVVPGNVRSLRPLLDAGVLGFKCFLVDSGLAEFPPVDAAALETALAELAPTGCPLLVHAEDDETVAAQPAPSGPSYAEFLASRPKAVENRAVEVVVRAARQTGGWAHVCHLSSAEALPLLAAARAGGVRVTAETCPHYLSLTAEEVGTGATAFKCCPPVREAANRDALWEGLSAGVLGLVVSDHSPCTVEMKHLDDGDFGAAWGGISSLQVSLPAVWTEARRRGFGLRDVVRWMAEETAGFAGLTRKGRIAPGFDADLVVFAPDEGFTVDGAALLHRNNVTPYDGHTLSGVVRTTLLRGEAVGVSAPSGRLLRHRTTSDRTGAQP